MQTFVDSSPGVWQAASPAPVRRTDKGVFRILVEASEPAGKALLESLRQRAESQPVAGARLEIVPGTAPEDLADRRVDLALLASQPADETLEAWNKAAFPRPVLVVGGRDLEEEDAAPVCALYWSGIHAVEEVHTALARAISAHRLMARYRFRRLEEEADLEQYLKLRYKVWKAAGYIPEERQPSERGWEIDFADTVSKPIAAFDRDGRIVACARLVQEIGKTARPQAERIAAMVEAAADKRLQDSLRGPIVPLHPFDLLEAFDGFQERYRELLHDRLRVAEVSRVIVDQEHQHQGLAVEMVDGLVELSRRKQVATLFLACRAELAPLYERSGFSPIPGMTAGRFGNIPVPSILMERCLRYCMRPPGGAR